ncbi:MAG: hypothetical protein Tsb009_14710 [Planctomycetaceae bacterium]
MYFRFGAAILLVVLISVTGVALEKSTLALKRDISRQEYQKDVLKEEYAKLRLRTQQLGAPTRVIEALDSQNEKQPSHSSAASSPLPKINTTDSKRRRFLLRWQRRLPDAELSP